mgnify:FL=1|jgi:bifunctional polynucleotide phosphatase/kinase
MTKLAIFDVDWTIIKPKNGRPFPKDKYDWMWLRESVPEILLHYYINDYQLVFLTDQSKDWKVDMIEGIIDLLNLNIILIVSRNKSTNKPNPQLFNQMITFPYRKRSSIMVGDAAGRTGDWADVDKEFSILSNIPFKTPEEIFPINELKTFQNIPETNYLEIVIMVGYQGSGKSTLCRDSFPNYVIISGDECKTPAKMIKKAKEYVNEYSLVFDATNGTLERRQMYIDFAREYNRPIRCVWLNMEIDIAIERIRQRELEGGSHVPKIALYKFRKSFVEPLEIEDLIKIDLV